MPWTPFVFNSLIGLSGCKLPKHIDGLITSGMSKLFWMIKIQYFISTPRNLRAYLSCLNDCHFECRVCRCQAASNHASSSSPSVE